MFGSSDVTGDIEGLVDRLAGPVAVFQRVSGQQQDRTALASALPDEFLALLVRRNAQNRQRPLIAHPASGA